MRSGAGWAPRMWRSTSLRLTPRRVQNSRPAEIVMPSAADRARRAWLSESALDKRHRDQVEQFLQQRLQRFQRCVAVQLRGELVTYDHGALERCMAQKAEAIDGDARLLLSLLGGPLSRHRSHTGGCGWLTEQRS